MAALAMPLIGGIGSLFGGLFGQSAATKAAQIQADASRYAANLESQNFNKALDFQRGVYTDTEGNLNPYISAGTSDFNTLQGMLPALTTPYENFQAPTGVDFTNDPAYQFDLQQGIKELNNSAAAKGDLLSGGTAEALSNYVQGNALNAYQNVYGNALQSYLANQQNYYTGQGNTFNRYASLANTGLGAADTLGSIGTSAGNSVADTLARLSAAQSNGINNAATAQAGGIVGGANALNAGISGALNAAQQGYTLSQIFPLLRASSYSNSTLPGGGATYGPSIPSAYDPNNPYGAAVGDYNPVGNYA